MNRAPIRYPSLADPDQLRALTARMTDYEIAEHIGCSYKSVKQARMRFQIPKLGDATYESRKRSRPISARELATLVERMTDEEIAEHIGCSPTTVYRQRMRVGISRKHAVEPDVTGVLPALRETAVLLSCPTCRWTHATMASAVHGAWQVDFDSKLRQEGRRVIHVPCGGAMTVYAHSAVERVR